MHKVSIEIAGISVGVVNDTHAPRIGRQSRPLSGFLTDTVRVSKITSFEAYGVVNRTCANVEPFIRVS